MTAKNNALQPLKVWNMEQKRDFTVNKQSNGQRLVQILYRMSLKILKSSAAGMWTASIW